MHTTYIQPTAVQDVHLYQEKSLLVQKSLGRSGACLKHVHKPALLVAGGGQPQYGLTAGIGR